MALRAAAQWPYERFESCSTAALRAAAQWPYERFESCSTAALRAAAQWPYERFESCSTAALRAAQWPYELQHSGLTSCSTAAYELQHSGLTSCSTVALRAAAQQPTSALRAAAQQPSSCSTAAYELQHSGITSCSSLRATQELQRQQLTSHCPAAPKAPPREQSRAQRVAPAREPLSSSSKAPPNSSRPLADPRSASKSRTRCFASLEPPRLRTLRPSACKIDRPSKYRILACSCHRVGAETPSLKRAFLKFNSRFNSSVLEVRSE